MSRKFIDITGQRFGRLTVIEHAGKTEKNVSLWRCRCDCGGEIVVPKKQLVGGGTRSCGCLHRGYEPKHGNARRGSRSKLYSIWVSMRQRCSNPKCSAWKWYGGKGIGVCPDWDNFSAFNNWATSSGYEPGLSIDRIDSGGNYEPDNCRWITLRENGMRALHPEGGDGQ